MIENDRRMWNIVTTLVAQQTNDATWITEIKSSTATAREVFNKNIILVTFKLGLNLRKTLVQFYSVTAFYCAENWTLRELGRK